jgi:hypothetical protein
MISALAVLICTCSLPKKCGDALATKFRVSNAVSELYIYYGVVPYIYKWLVCANLLNRALESIVIECT